MPRIIIACIGGFLGAGKTTSLRAAALELAARNLRVGIITNDQGTELVDTKALEDLGVAAAEIGGGCFCCKFDDLVEQAQAVLDAGRPDIILAEAVGSCTDLSATVYRPLRKYYGHRFSLAPLTVVVEPERLRSLLGGGGASGFPETVSYLFEKQLMEADLVVLNKADTVTPAEADELSRRVAELTGGVPVQRMSALAGSGVAEWVDALLSGRRAGTRTLDIDYETYARAEAALGWLNATVEVTAAHEFSPRELATSLIERMQRGAIDGGMSIAHLKILVATDAETDRIALTDNAGRPQWSVGGDFPAAVRELSLTINARVHTSPEELTRVTRDSVAASASDFGVRAEVEHLESFSPLPPKPRYRMAEAESL